MDSHIQLVIPPEKGVSDLASSISPLGVFMSSFVPDYCAIGRMKNVVMISTLLLY